MPKYVSDGQTTYEPDIDNLVQAVLGNGILTGMAVSAQSVPNMTVQVAGGTIQYSAAPVTVGATASLAIAAADPSLPRVDLVVVSSVGVVSAVTGTPATTPKPPALPSTSLLLAYVSVAASAVNIQNSNITPRLLFVGSGAAGGVPAFTLGTANAQGAASTFVRTDASIAIFDGTVPVTQAFGDAAATGSAAVASRRDHKHGMPSSSFNAATTVRYTDDFVFSNPVTGNAMGSLNWTLAVTNGTAVYLTGTSGHPGILQLNTSANANSTSALVARATGQPMSILPSDFFDVTIVLRPSSTVDTNMVIVAGLGAVIDQGAPPNDGCYIEKATADTQWFGVCRNANTQTRTAALGAVTNGTWAKLRIRRVDASTIGFTLDANAEVTLTTNIPTAALVPGFKISNVAVAAGRTCDFDLYDLTITGLTR